MKQLKVLALISLMVLSTSSTLEVTKADADPVGSWECKSPDAPSYEYATWTMVITKEGNELKGEVIFNEYSKVKLQDLKIEGNVLTVKAYIEGELVSSKGTITGDDIKGEVTSSMGIVHFTGKKKK